MVPREVTKPPGRKQNPKCLILSLPGVLALQCCVTEPNPGDLKQQQLVICQTVGVLGGRGSSVHYTCLWGWRGRGQQDGNTAILQGPSIPLGQSQGTPFPLPVAVQS